MRKSLLFMWLELFIIVLQANLLGVSSATQPTAFANGWGKVHATGISGDPYDVALKAYCNVCGHVNVNITMDGTLTEYKTPHNFTGLTGTHNFTVPWWDPGGHHFTKWSTNETSLTITISSGGTYTAYYWYSAPPPPQYALAISATMGGTTNPSPGTHWYYYGTVVPVRAIPDTNYLFDYWELDGSNKGSTNPISITMNTNHTLKAYFVYSPPPPPPPPPPPSVGGVVVPIDKFGLLAPYIGLASTIVVATVAIAIYAKRVKRRREK